MITQAQINEAIRNLDKTFYEQDFQSYIEVNKFLKDVELSLKSEIKQVPALFKEKDNS